MIKWGRILYQPNLPLGENGKRVTACEEHRLLSRNAAKEGMVLLKNEEQVLPLAKGKKIALFGKGTFDYVKGGGGSGDVTVEYVVNLYEGFRALNDQVAVEENLADYYRRYVQQQYQEGGLPGMIAEPELPDELCQNARLFTDTAIISISRYSGEYWDRTVAGKKVDGGLRAALVDRANELFEYGDFYLSAAEAAMAEKVCALFDNVIVVLNVGGMIDTEWFHENKKIKSVLLALQGGMEGGRAIAELLCGLANPSGKLSDTFAKRLEDYPSTAGFHDSDLYVDYNEDIYVGYRYFETLPGAAERVNYPFGYGLSYTEFEWSIVSAEEKDGRIQVRVQVTNIGKMAGKEVFQSYYSAPQGLLGKPARSLATFRKTKLLRPGEQQTVILEWNVDAMASYDDLGKVAKSAYVLEKGQYRFFVGTSVRDTVELDYVHQEREDRIVEQLSEKIAPAALRQRLLADGSYEPLPQRPFADPREDEDYPYAREYEFAQPGVRAVAPKKVDPKTRKPIGKFNTMNFNRVADGSMSLDEFVAGLSCEELAHMLGGQPNTGVGITYGVGNLPEYEVPNAITADGPAGLRVRPGRDVYTTAFPCATLLACTWNEELLFRVGEAGAKEVRENNMSTWLTPAVNIHRSPLCGRNFEYYSEDPLLAGVLAASLVKGIQSQHIAPSVKHFALNNKETNRKNSDSRVSERAAREIYLKVFEIIVKTAKPWTLMSSYNIINGTRASENRELLEDILRGEWGFDGMVFSDWWTYGSHYKEVKAGNDVKMACGYPDQLLKALETGKLTREEMEICAKRVLKLILRFD